jgi:hypothetical protein
MQPLPLAVVLTPFAAALVFALLLDQVKVACSVPLGRLAATRDLDCTLVADSGSMIPPAMDRIAHLHCEPGRVRAPMRKHKPGA